MFSSQTRWNATPLYWEMLKLKALIGLEKLLSIGQSNDKCVNRKVSQEHSVDCVTALARETDTGHYEVILPFTGKVLMEKHAFELAHRPLEPAMVRAGWESDSAAQRSVYHKYIVVAPQAICQAA